MDTTYHSNIPIETLSLLDCDVRNFNFIHPIKNIFFYTFYPSSQTCHCCGYKNEETKDLKVREWTCPKCHAEHDRDINASINILMQGILVN